MAKKSATKTAKTPSSNERSTNAPATVLALIDRFAEHADAYHAGKYNETQIRREFIDPLFKALGWDVDNTQGYAEAYKDVIHEDAIKIGGATKAPDYCFRIGGTRKFFVEAKKPSVDIKGDPGPAYQLRRYAWSAKLPLSILTDFEELAVYDCRVKPSPQDKSSKARTLYLRYDELPKRWDELASIFSREAILKGSFDKYADSAKKKRGTAQVDDAFLAEIEHWRDGLARNIALRNKSLSQRELNFAVQRTIDRIVFLRICEDRGIEQYGTLQDIAGGKGIYQRLFERFRRADERYNSGLFHFSKEKGRSDAPDDLTPNLTIDDKPLTDILKRLYYPDSPYEFSVLPADILGQVYEQFLGKVIELSASHRAKVVEKPEVRKAGGVYYTPTYIVNYIVESTVGKLVEGRTPQEVGALTAKLQPSKAKDARPLTVLDPACGSGSFLLGAYQFLLDWYRDRYVEEGVDNHTGGKTPRLFQHSSGEYRLTTAERKRILLSHIYGVDIDTQAVEVTKLSLLLKVLEGESDETLGANLRLFHERALPDLAENIKCGNSLIGPDFYDNVQLNIFDEEQRLRINVFDWHSEFKEIMAGGGFDAVIGNPPYFNMDDTWGHDDPRSAYIKRAYPAIYRDKTDILFYFLGRGVTLQSGCLMFIVSRAFLEAYKADKLREFLTRKMDIAEITDFRNYHVFPGVGITTALIKLAPEGRIGQAIFRKLTPAREAADLPPDPNDPEHFDVVSVDQDRLDTDPWLFGSEGVQELLDKIDAAGVHIGEILLIGQGMQTGRNGVFGKLDHATVEAWNLPDGMIYTRARNSDIHRYRISDSGEGLLYVEDVADFDELPEPVQTHLETHDTELKERAAFKRGDCDWWRYTWPLHADYHDRPKLYCPYLAKHNRFAPDFDRRYLGLTDTTVLFENGQPENLLYLLGLLNSNLLTFRFAYIGKLKSGGILEYFWNSVSRLPIRRIDFDNPADIARHDLMVSLVQIMLDLHAQLQSAMGHAARTIQRQIEATDRRINQLVYELHGLTDDEVVIVEAAIE